MTRHDIENACRRYEAADRMELEPEFRVKHDLARWAIWTATTTAIGIAIYLAIVLAIIIRGML